MEVNKKSSVGDDGDSDRTEEVEIQIITYGLMGRIAGRGLEKRA